MIERRAVVRCALFGLLSMPGLSRAVSADDAAAGATLTERVRYDLTSTTLASWHTGPASHGDLFERLNLGSGVDAWRVGLRIDTASFAWRSPAFMGGADRYTLEKVWITWSGRSLAITAGDAYLSFGRGLALSLRKVDELGVDTTLRGIKVQCHGERLSGTLAAGYTNINNVDQASGKSIDDPRDLIAGAQIEGSLGGGITVGAHGSALAFRDGLGLVPKPAYQDRVLAFGPTIDAPRVTRWLGFYLEGIGQVRQVEADPSDRSTAFGVYGSANAFFGRATVLLEGKAYGGLLPLKPQVPRAEFATVAYNNPPTVERLLQVIDNPQRDIAGGRLRLDWNFSPELVATVGYGLFWDWQGYADPAAVGSNRPAAIHDPHIGIEVRPADGKSWLLASAGWRVVLLQGAGTMVRADAHGEIDWARSVGDSFSLTVHALGDRRRKYESPILNQEFSEGTVLAGVRWQRWLAVAAGYDFTTDPTQPKRDYWSGTVECNLTTSSSLRMFVGGTRGGLRCVSGVCRMFPPFEGVQLAATVRL